MKNTPFKQVLQYLILTSSKRGGSQKIHEIVKKKLWTGPESTWTSCGKMVKNCELIMNKLWIGPEQVMNKGVNKLRTSP